MGKPDSEQAKSPLHNIYTIVRSLTVRPFCICVVSACIYVHVRARLQSLHALEMWKRAYVKMCARKKYTAMQGKIFARKILCKMYVDAFNPLPSNLNLKKFISN